MSKIEFTEIQNKEDADTKIKTDEELEQNSQDYESQYSQKQRNELHQDFKRNYGNNFIFCIGRNGQPAITIGPHWPLFLCAFTCLTIIGVLVIRHIVHKDKWPISILTIIICLGQLISYLNVALTNPGIASSSTRAENELELLKEGNFCKPCQILKKKDIYHCDDCDVCVYGYDHHCPWTGKCIGKGNISQFYCFLTMTFIFMIYSIIITVIVM